MGRKRRRINENLPPGVYRKRNGLNYLNELLRYDDKSGNIFYVGGNRADKISTGGYKIICMRGLILKAHRVAWLLHTGEWPNGHIDHINGNPSDNRIENLRVVDQVENMRNAKLYASNKSGIPGVRWREDKNRWISSIKIYGRHMALGSYKSFLDACSARKSAELKYGFHKNHGKRVSGS